MKKDRPSPQRRTYRVAHVGTGLTGREALRAIIDDPTLQLVGVLVSSPDKLGRDAGELCGLPATGVAATSDAEVIVAAHPDCVCYCATAVRRGEEAIADIVRFLRAGIDVVTISTIPLVYPPAAPPHWVRALQDAAAGGSTFYATGCEPGVASLNLPTALLAGAGRVDSCRLDEYALDLDHSYPLWDVLHESMGFGKPDGHVPARIAAGKVDADWTAVVRYLADILGIRLDSVDLDWETLVAPSDLTTAVGVIPQGTICGHRWCLAGMRNGEPAVAVQYFATVSTTPWPERWPSPGSGGGMIFRVQGSPNMRMELYFEPSAEDRVNPGVAVTAAALVNAIPRVVDAEPGVVNNPLAGPAVVTRRSRTLASPPSV